MELPDQAARWGGFALGVLAPPLLVLLLALGITTVWAGLDGGPTYGIAVTGTRDLAAALDRYRARYHRIPDAKEGGLARLAPEFLPAVPNDPWGRPYIYDPSGPSWADVMSYGADGKAGGNGADGDVSARFGRLGARPPGFLHAFASLLLMGAALAAALAGARHLWCASVLAGMSAFWGGLLLAMVGAFQSLLGPLAFAAGIGALTGAVAVLRDLPYARLVAFLAVVSAYLLVQLLMVGFT
ncbi:MAG: type II secretion system protein GspG [Deltaproteobacteria bacterium]|nr:type II secretion system protein GspG [Deltaproteobacteria bacterium]